MWREFFRVSSREMYGIIALGIIVVAMLFVSQCTDLTKGKRHVVIDRTETFEPPYANPDFDNDTLHINTATTSQLSYFGFSNYAVVRIMKYREAGGYFLNIDELNTFYGVDTALVNSRYANNLLAFDFDTDQRAYTKRHNRNESQRSYDRNYKYKKYQQPRDEKISLYYSSPEELTDKGVAADVIDSLLAYRERYTIGGSLPLSSLQNTTAQDLYALIEPNITGLRTSFEKVVKAPKPRLDINTATKNQLMELKGIGDYLSSEIIKRRTALGGFVSTRQLLEIPQITQDRFPFIDRQITVDTTQVKKININHTYPKILSVHPYIGQKLTRKITNYRKQNPIDNQQELEEICQGFDVSEFLYLYIDYSEKK